MRLREYFGEFLGTFILVLFGCSAVAGAVLFDAFGSLLEVALIWGFGVALAIFCIRNICPAHLNPAVSLAMFFAKKLSLKKLLPYVFFQTLGAFAAGAVIYFMFGDAIAFYESGHAILRGSAESYQSAVMFGEFFPNPDFEAKLSISVPLACFMEAFGTFILVFVIFRLTEKTEQMDNLTPVLIGLTVSLIICLVAPFTQAGLNPARDFGPRMVAYFAGWGEAAFPSGNLSFLTVYILSPMAGGGAATGLHKFLIKHSEV